MYNFLGNLSAVVNFTFPLETYKSPIAPIWTVLERIAGVLNLLNLLLILITVIRLVMFKNEKIEKTDFILRIGNMIFIGIVLALNIAGIIGDSRINQDTDTYLIDAALIVAALSNLLSYYCIIILFRVYNARLPVVNQNTIENP